ncbi:MAG: acyl-coenzyme A synthetase/AMP-(fatty) acid ligase [Cyclobacteriaceae bacterium]|jgi:acyl-coenzyme A synthetase/AMP-(fatty) acid ligase
MKMIFQCTNCQSDLISHSVGYEHDDCLNGCLTCSNCSNNVPIVNGITYFTEIDINYNENLFSNLEKVSQTLSDKREEYLTFIKQKVSKGMVDPYSAFQPFNESSRSFYPFIEGLRKNALEPGDVILDTWCRTGWTGYFLSALFPDQKVISVWEGNKDVLGYQGFDYWFSPDKKPKNLEVVFLDMNDRLPIKDNTIKLVYGLDTLHRYDQATMIQELLRVTTTEGVILWPHVHLANSAPVPFFERGEKQLHGTDYDRYFQKCLDGTGKMGFVASEPKMFEVNAVQTLLNTPDSEDYNALVGILPKDLKDFELRPYHFESEDPARLFVLVNPYMKVDLCRSLIHVDRSYLNGVVGKMLDRHSIYQEKIGAADGYKLSETQTKIIYLSRHNYSFTEMVKLLNISDKHLINELKKLADKEIIHVLPLDINAMNLQAFHSAQSPTEKASNHTLFNLRVLSRDSFQQQPILVNSTDASELQNEDVSYLIQELQKRLQKAAIDEGDKIVIVSKPHFEALLTFWGASEMGIEVCILSTEIPTKIKQKLLKSIIPELVLTDTKIYHELVSELTDIRVLAFDDEDFTGSDENLFSNWLEEDGNLSDSKASWIPTPNSIAATLFTSGTTGMPKGIQLSHGALYRSGELLSRTYGWRSNDRLLMVAELDSMSGLRNTCVATQFTGTTVIIPDFKNDQHIFSIVESIKGNQVTLLTSTPALIKQLIQLGKRIKNDLRSLRQVICTGGNLSVSAVEEFRNLFGIKIINYYGLTETTGLCIGELENAPNDVLGSIGVAVDAIAQVVDNNLKLLEPGEIGKLRIYNDRLMSGYLNPDDETNLQIENGWLYTGDWAVQDEYGNFFLKGRERDIIKDQAGNIVYLIEVEQCLTSHNKVKDVAICGEQNDANEYLIAFIIIHDDFMNEKEVLENELKEYVGSEIGSNKTPSKIIFKDEFQSNSRAKWIKKL